MQELCWCTDQTFRVLQEALCEALYNLHANMTLQVMEWSRSIDSANVTDLNLVFPGFLTFL